MAKFVCGDCGLEYPKAGLPHLCPACGGIFTLTGLVYDPDSRVNLPGMWTYRELMGIDDHPNCYLGEGQTALVERNVGEIRFFAKLEGLNPSGSFKDRNSAIVTSLLWARGIQSVVEDSSGNAGASLATYAAAYGIDSQIFIPSGTVGPKVNQIIASGAKVTRIPGLREEAHKAALNELKKREAVYASHALLPFGLAAYATIAFEIFEQLGKLPDTVYCPIGHGSLFLGVLLGFRVVTNYLGHGERPRMVGVQPERCAPLVNAWKGQASTGCSLPSLAEGTMVAQPARAKEILNELSRGYDQLVAIQEEQIDPSRLELARMGVYVEPTSAMVYAALNKKVVPTEGINVLIISGNGLKFNPPIDK